MCYNISAMKKKKSKQQRNLEKAEKKREQARRDELEKRELYIDYGTYPELKRTTAYAGSPQDLGKLLYSYSDSRTWIDLPSEQKFRKIFSPQRVFLFTLAALLCGWFITALIYQLCTTSNTGKTLLQLLPSFILIAACVAILLISAFMKWGKFVRWAYRHNLVRRGRDAFARERNRQMRAELDRADKNKPYENAIDITTDYIILKLLGEEYVFYREHVSATVEKSFNGLTVKFNIAGKTRIFPTSLPSEEFVPLKKALREKLTAVRSEHVKDYDLRENSVKEIPFLFGVLLILAAGVMLVVTHYLWVPDIPPFLGVFFILVSFLALGNTLSFIKPISELGIPLVFAITLLAVPPWALVWMQRNIMHGGSVLQIFLKCDVMTAGFSFFTVIGAYVLIFAVSKIVDYIRFGKFD
ncbi:MAG: ribosome biogenesis protein NOP53 [Clostridiales bacterium]|nr:ribosome biogenesis protein NOP53 [Clostridiales bacterium]